MKTIAQLFTAFGVLALAGVLYFFVVKFDTYLTYKGQHDCAQDYKLEYIDVNTNTSVTKPIDDLYQQCLSDKGL